MLVLLYPLISPETITQLISRMGQYFIKGNCIPHPQKFSHKSETLFSSGLLYSYSSAPCLRELGFLLYKGVPIISLSNLNYFLKGLLTSLPFFDLIPSELILSEFLLCIIRFYFFWKKKSLGIKKKMSWLLNMNLNSCHLHLNLQWSFLGPPLHQIILLTKKGRQVRRVKMKLWDIPGRS